MKKYEVSEWIGTFRSSSEIIADKIEVKDNQTLLFIKDELIATFPYTKSIVLINEYNKNNEYSKLKSKIDSLIDIINNYELYPVDVNNKVKNLINEIKNLIQ
jgi:cell fate (sporulation/competence/biofilm development) regulator YmcA (YheA/YmcA/DUF963 family)